MMGRTEPDGACGRQHLGVIRPAAGLLRHLKAVRMGGVKAVRRQWKVEDGQ